MERCRQFVVEGKWQQLDARVVFVQLAVLRVCYEYNAETRRFSDTNFVNLNLIVSSVEASR